MLWFAKQADGFRGWLAVAQSSGVLRTGLLAGDFVVTIVNPSDSSGSTVSVSESSTKPGLYIFDIPSAFITTNGVGEYAVVIEINTKTGPSGAPHVVLSLNNVLKVSQEDFDSLTASVWDEAVVSHAIAGSFGDAITDIKTATVSVSGHTVTAGSTVSSVNTTLTNVDGTYDGLLFILTNVSSGLVVSRRIAAYLQASGNVKLEEDLPFTPDIGDPVRIGSIYSQNSKAGFA